MKNARLRVRGALVAAAFCASVLAPSNAAQAAGEDQFKAAYLLNFARYTEWPKEAFPSDASPIRICVLGSESFFETVRKTVGDRTAGDRRVEVEARSGPAGAGECHIFYLGASHEETASAVIAEASGSNVFTVAGWPGFAKQGGTANFFLEGKKVRFAINSNVASKEELQISSRLLRIAKIVN
jgi:hypothetical protein